MEKIELSTGSLTLLITLLAIFLGGVVYAVLTAQWRINMTGTVKTVGLKVLDESNNEVQIINWGELSPGESIAFYCFAYNDGTVPITLAYTTENWNPPEASNYISLAWNYTGNIINPKEKLPLKLTLTISPDITGISSFSFDMVIIAQESG